MTKTRTRSNKKHITSTSSTYCDKCKCDFDTVCDLKKHQKTKCGNSGSKTSKIQVTKCKYCPMKYAKKNDLVAHIEICKNNPQNKKPMPTTKKVSKPKDTENKVREIAKKKPEKIMNSSKESSSSQSELNEDEKELAEYVTEQILFLSSIREILACLSLQKQAWILQIMMDRSLVPEDEEINNSKFRDCAIYEKMKPVFLLNKEILRTMSYKDDPMPPGEPKIYVKEAEKIINEAGETVEIPGRVKIVCEPINHDMLPDSNNNKRSNTKKHKRSRKK